jgi:predicted ester cyclase
MSTEQAKATLRTAVAAFNAGDVDGFLAMFDSSLAHHGLGPEPLDEKGNRAFYEGFAGAFAGCQIVLDDVVAEGDRIAVRFHVTGRHEGEFLGMAPTGRSIHVDAQAIMRFADGRVVERWTTADLMGLMGQIG